MAEQSQLTLEVQLQQGLPCVNGDQRQLSQVVANLLENAIKYTTAGGRVVTSLAESQGGLLVTVTDTGIGIPQEVQSRVFERFYRVQQPGFEHVSGSGLGLSLVRDIVVAHHGRVWLESQPGIGTSAYVWLPIPQEVIS
jgi:signal transduction histidine kinase